eukprot:CAMPEP_0198649868 /NCGR_PEP_ID=MMETSP1467-20131203/4583_1 /TAXON_ID=1462469 /ORGANISM="unid. sp., Strain CCMP2135" /LENGTH=168 /DNA_ID=CAMNT_0044385683 /DNA_START=421 /DNA_END=927 /DNA_ORIENTATION=+
MPPSSPPPPLSSDDGCRGTWAKGGDRKEAVAEVSALRLPQRANDCAGGDVDEGSAGLGDDDEESRVWREGDLIHLLAGARYNLAVERPGPSVPKIHGVVEEGREVVTISRKCETGRVARAGVRALDVEEGASIFTARYVHDVVHAVRIESLRVRREVDAGGVNAVPFE